MEVLERARRGPGLVRAAACGVRFSLSLSLFPRPMPRQPLFSLSQTKEEEKSRESRRAQLSEAFPKKDQLYKNPLGYARSLSRVASLWKMSTQSISEGASSIQSLSGSLTEARLAFARAASGASSQRSTSVTSEAQYASSSRCHAACRNATLTRKSRESSRGLQSVEDLAREWAF